MIIFYPSHVYIKNENYTLLNACAVVVNSLVLCTKEEDYRLLELPVLNNE